MVRKKKTEPGEPEIEKYFKIGEVAKFSGLSTSTLNFYESKKLINYYKKDENGYRLYDEEVFDILRRTKRLKKDGKTIDEIIELLYGKVK